MDDPKKYSDYLFIETELFPVQVAFVFGTSHSQDAFADRTVELWKQNLFQKIIVTGGVITKTGESEARMLCRLMMERGVPRSVFLIEERSKNTGENVELAKPILEAHFGVGKVNSILSIGKMHAARRCLMTLQKHFPDATKLSAPVHVAPVHKEQWYDDSFLKEKVYSEWRKIPRYLEMGYIEELNEDELRKHLRKRS